MSGLPLEPAWLWMIGGVLLLIGIALYTINLLLERRGAIDRGTSAG